MLCFNTIKIDCVRVAVYLCMKKLLFLLTLLIISCGCIVNLQNSIGVTYKNVKEPGVAGAFYPDEREGLKKLISSYMENPGKEELRDIGILIAPHAGYVYSGQVAAYAFKQVEGEQYDTVIVIGVSHHFPFDGVSVFNGTHYRTPLGEVRMDLDLGEKLIESSEKIYYEPGAEEKEHSVEVQIPFLQQSLKDFKLVTIIMGGQDYETSQLLAKAIGENAKGKTLVVASSDMSHYYPSEQAEKLDATCLSLYKHKDPQVLYSVLERGYCQLCGQGPVVTALMLAKEWGYDEIRILNYANSGDITGDDESVVGYSSACFSKGGKYSQEEREVLLDIARESIEAYVTEKRFLEFDIKDKKLKENTAAFVTINEDDQLRGCIGTIQEIQPLYLAVRNYAVAAATGDPRFKPVAEEELDRIELEISVLFNFKEIKNPGEITVGRHGLIIEKGKISGLLLPQVATDYGWDRTEFLEQTCEKAGLPGGCWREGARITTFEAEVFGE